MPISIEVSMFANGPVVTFYSNYNAHYGRWEEAREHHPVTRSSLIRAQRIQLALYDALPPAPGERICWACECRRVDDDSDCAHCGADRERY